MSQTPEALKTRITEDMKTAMRAKDKERLGTIRLIQAAIKQKEIDERIELDDSQVMTVLDKMVKQRRDSIEQFSKAGRQDLADKETAELAIIQEYMPAALSEDEVLAIIDEVIHSTGAASPKDMGKVMGALKPRLQGRADMGAVSGMVKSRLSG
jgi:uncharacterized protein YqeY